MPQATEPVGPGPSVEATERAISLASGYLVRACRASGQFEYRINLDQEVSVRPKYNVLRHAGAMYGLAMSFRHRPLPDVSEAVRRASQFLIQNCVAPLDQSPQLLAVWSPPELTHSDAPLQAKLGGPH